MTGLLSRCRTGGCSVRVRVNARTDERSAAMSQLTHWNPWKELEDVHNRLSSLFNDKPARWSASNEAMAVADWSPRVDISEDSRAYVIKAELPEVKKDEVTVTMEDGVLTLAGERKFEKEENGLKHHRIERAYGSFSRSFTLPRDAESEKITATHKDGVLTITVEKSEQVKPKQIEVTVT